MRDKEKSREQENREQHDPMGVEGYSKLKADESDAIKTDDPHYKYEQWTTRQLHEKADELKIDGHKDTGLRHEFRKTLLRLCVIMI